MFSFQRLYMSNVSAFDRGGGSVEKQSKVYPKTGPQGVASPRTPFVRAGKSGRTICILAAFERCYNLAAFERGSFHYHCCRQLQFESFSQSTI